MGDRPLPLLTVEVRESEGGAKPFQEGRRTTQSRMTKSSRSLMAVVSKDTGPMGVPVKDVLDKGRTPASGNCTGLARGHNRSG